MPVVNEEVMRKIISILFLGVLFPAAALPALATDKRDLYIRNKIRDDRCQKNLGALYERLKFYAEKHNGNLPQANNGAGLLQAVDEKNDHKYFLCNASRLKKIRHERDLKVENVPYIYFGDINLPAALKQCPQLPLVADRPDAKHYFVLLADGTVIELKPAKAKRKISNCMDMLEMLNDMYHYPADVLEAMRIKARSIDRNEKWK